MIRRWVFPLRNCEIFRDLRLCVCVKPNRAEREFDLGDLERDRLVAVFMSD